MRSSPFLPLALSLLLVACGDSTAPVEPPSAVVPTAAPPAAEPPVVGPLAAEPPAAEPPAAEPPAAEPPPAPVPASATLTTSLSRLALFVDGAPRTITIANPSGDEASNVVYTVAPALPAGTTISPASCGTIAAGGSCVLTVTPGPTASAAPGDPAPESITLAVAGDNTNISNIAVDVLAYGSVYQSGYLFAVDDTTADTASIGGKVVALTDQALPPTGRIRWSSNSDNSGVEYGAVAGINDTSHAGADSCAGLNEGDCNSERIIAHFTTNRSSGSPVDLSYYAAGSCRLKNDDYSDWYLPAICEQGGSDGACGPGTQNVQRNLVENGDIGSIRGYYWASTQAGFASYDMAFMYDHFPGQIMEFVADRSYDAKVRCVRRLTP